MSRFVVLVGFRRKPVTGARFLDPVTANEGAFEEHLNTPDFTTFKAASAGIVEDRVLRKCDVRENAA